MKQGRANSHLVQSHARRKRLHSSVTRHVAPEAHPELRGVPASALISVKVLKKGKTVPNWSKWPELDGDFVCDLLTPFHVFINAM